MNEVTAKMRQHFDEGGTVRTAVETFGVTTSSAKHYHIEWQQAVGRESKHHPEGKAVQIHKVLEGKSDLSIYEIYGGHGYCTGVYETYGKVISRTHVDGNDWHVTHAELASGRTYDVVDIDGYGYPSRIMAAGVVELLKGRGTMFLTFPVYGANHGNGITSAHLRIFYGTDSPEVEDFVRAFKVHALAYHRVATLVHSAKLGRVWRLAFEVERVPATLLYGVRNRPEREATEPIISEVPTIYLDLEVAAKPARKKAAVESGPDIFDLFGGGA